MEKLVINTSRQPVVVLLLAFLGTSILWFIGFIYSWLVAEFGCQSNPAEISLAGVGLVAWMQFAGRGLLILAVMGLLIYAHVIKSQFATQPERDETSEMNLFLARSGWIASLILLTVMLVETVPVFYFLRSCW